MSVAIISTIGIVATNLIVNHPKKIYEERINDLNTYVTQLDNHIANMRTYRSELPHFWEGESADRYAALMEIELRSLEEMRSIVRDDIAFYQGLIADLDVTNRFTSSIIEDTKAVLGALESTISSAAGGGSSGGGGVR